GLQVGDDGVIAPDPAAVVLRAEAERRVQSEAEAPAIGERVREVEGRDQAGLAGVTAVVAAERSATDARIHPRPPVVEVKRRDGGVARARELGAPEERQPGGVVRDGAGILRHRHLAGECTAQAARAPLEEREAGAGGVASGCEPACYN